MSDKNGLSVVFALEDWAWKIVDVRIPPSIFEKKMHSENPLTGTVRTNTPDTDISTAQLTASERGFVANVRFLATDLEHMFSNTMVERSGVDLSPPGVLETEIGRFVQRRVAIHDKKGMPCSSRVQSAGEDPDNAVNALIVLRFECAGNGGKLSYDATGLIAAHGRNGKHLVTITKGQSADDTVLSPGRSVLELP